MGTCPQGTVPEQAGKIRIMGQAVLRDPAAAAHSPAPICFEQSAGFSGKYTWVQSDVKAGSTRKTSRIPGRPPGVPGPAERWLPEHILPRKHKAELGEGRKPYAFFRVRKAPMAAPAKSMGADLANSHSNT